MTYTNTWSDTRPLGSAQANTADDEMRAIRLDVHERMDDIVEDWTADPVVLKIDTVGGKTGKQLIIAAPDFVLDPNDGTGNNYRNERLVVSANAGPIYAPLTLPPNVVITKIEWLLINDDNNALTMKVLSTAFSATLTQTTEYETTSTVSGTFIHESGTLSLTISADKIYSLFIDKESDASAYSICGARITYDTPNLLATI